MFFKSKIIWKQQIKKIICFILKWSYFASLSLGSACRLQTPGKSLARNGGVWTGEKCDPVKSEEGAEHCWGQGPVSLSSGEGSQNGGGAQAGSQQEESVGLEQHHYQLNTGTQATLKTSNFKKTHLKFFEIFFLNKSPQIISRFFSKKFT